MACTGCQREVLFVFLHEVANISARRSILRWHGTLPHRDARNFRTLSSHHLQPTTKTQHTEARTELSSLQSDESYIPFDKSALRARHAQEESNFPLPHAYDPPPPPSQYLLDPLDLEPSTWASRRSVSSFQADVALNGSEFNENGLEVAATNTVSSADLAISVIAEHDVKAVQLGGKNSGAKATTRDRGQRAVKLKCPNLRKVSKTTHEQRLQRWRAQTVITNSPDRETTAAEAKQNPMKDEKPSFMKTFADKQESATTDFTKLPMKISTAASAKASDVARRTKHKERGNRVLEEMVVRSSPSSYAKPFRKSATTLNAAAEEKPEREPWQVQKSALKSKFGDQTWAPRKRLSPDAVEGIRALHTQYPEEFSTPQLAARFEVSPEAIRRILKSKWKPNEKEEEERRIRWDKRGEKIWSQLVVKGVHPPKKWRLMGIGGGPRYASQGGTSLSNRTSILGTRMLPGKRDADEEEKAKTLQTNKGSAWIESMVNRI